MSERVLLEQQGQVALVTLNNGKANAISHELLDELNEILDTVEAAGQVLVLTGQPGMFSAGFDLAVMKSSMDEAMKLVCRGSELSHRLLSFPTPVIAACTGHAVAKGAFLLLSADVRLLTEGDFKIGLNEVAIGMTMHNAGISLSLERLARSHFERSVLCAEMFDPKEAVRAGFGDRVLPAEQVVPAAMALAKQLSQLNARAHHQTKLKARSGWLQELQDAIEADRTSTL